MFQASLYDDLPIVDAHHHLWDLEGAISYPWLKPASGEHSFMGDNAALRRTYLPAEYRRDTGLHNVIATVHIEAECDRNYQVAETEWVTGIACESSWSWSLPQIQTLRNASSAVQTCCSVWDSVMH